MMNDCVNGHSEDAGSDISMQWLSRVSGLQREPICSGPGPVREGGIWGWHDFTMVAQAFLENHGYCRAEAP